MDVRLPISSIFLVIVLISPALALCCVLNFLLILTEKKPAFMLKIGFLTVFIKYSGMSASISFTDYSLSSAFTLTYSSFFAE